MKGAFFLSRFKFMDLLIFQAPMLMVQATMDGLILGIIFALVAYGMALQWGVMNIINIAQGELVIMGGYVGYGLYIYGNSPSLWSIDISNHYVLRGLGIVQISYK